MSKRVFDTLKNMEREINRMYAQQSPMELELGLDVFEFSTNCPSRPAYCCNKPGDNSGVYYRKDQVIDLLGRLLKRTEELDQAHRQAEMEVLALEEEMEAAVQDHPVDIGVETKS